MKAVVDISFVSAEKIRELNYRYRHKNRPTDVLSFPLENFQPGPDDIIRLGDIVICRAEAKKRRHSLTFLIRHAMLHLIGIHHPE